MLAPALKDLVIAEVNMIACGTQSGDHGKEDNHMVIKPSKTWCNSIQKSIENR